MCYAIDFLLKVLYNIINNWKGGVIIWQRTYSKIL